MSLDEWDIVINVHLNGSAYVSWYAWPIMYEKNYGRILFTSSVSGILGSFGQANWGSQNGNGWFDEQSFKGGSFT